MSSEAFLFEWGRVVDALTQLVTAALEVDPPGALLPAWQAQLTRYGVEALHEDARLEAVLAARQSKGAPLAEVEACLETLSAQSRRRLAPLRRGLAPEQGTVLDASLDQLVARALAHVRDQSTARKRGLFASARELASRHQYSQDRAVVSYVLTCTQCRAPRLGDTLQCAFCGGSLEHMG